MQALKSALYFREFQSFVNCLAVDPAVPATFLNR